MKSWLLTICCVGVVGLLSTSALAQSCTVDTDCDDGVSCTDDTCPAGTCVFTPNDGNCDDGQFCNGAETCDAVLDCQAGTPPDCSVLLDDGVGCTDDICDPAAGGGAGACVNTPNDANCDDAQFCNGAETCDAVLDCQAGTPPDCTVLNDDGVGCTDDVCDPAASGGAGACVNNANDANCDDAQFCNGAETCDAVLDCQAGTPPDCAVLNDDGVGCTDDVCDPAASGGAGACVNDPNDANCDDTLFCNGTETCDAVLDCQAGTNPCDDGVGCTLDNCDDILDTCANTPDDGICDDGQFCNGDETCDPVLDCQVGTPPDCSVLNDDGVGCTDDICDPAASGGAGDCVNNPVDANCDNGLPCDGAEVCDAVLDCQAGTPVDCSSLDGDCAVGVCNAGTGVCEPSAINEGGTCDDSDLCTVGSTCASGVCGSASPVDCSSLDDDCNLGACNPSSGACFSSPTNNGGVCDDGNVCTLSDTCVFGACTGTPDPGCSPVLNMLVSATTLPVSTCYSDGDLITVELEMGASSVPIVGGQFFLEYDPNTLSVVSIDPGDPPFTNEIFESVNATTGTIDYAVGVPTQDPGTTLQTRMAVLTFEAVAECDTYIRFRPHSPPTTLTDFDGVARPPVITPLPNNLRIDGSAPILTCPGDISVDADAGTITAAVTFTPASGIDSCDPTTTVTCTSAPVPGLQNGGTFPSGTTTIDCVATNSCGVQGTCSFDVDVSPFNEMLINIEMSPTIVAGPLTRCITFEVSQCGIAQAESSAEIDFGGLFSVPGRAENVSVLIPAGPWECITARDELHTLTSRSPNFSDNGTTYSASFMGNRALGGHWLTSGNLNDDDVIDILDYAIWNANFGLTFANTSCTDTPPHADINGDGLANVFDFTFIQRNFFMQSEAGCCGTSPAFSGGLTEISVEELIARGLGNLVSADVNGDGMVDLEDMQATMDQANPADPQDGRSPVEPRTGRSKATRSRR